jgi:hypothetical protein
MAYLSDGCLLKKLGGMCRKIAKFLNNNTINDTVNPLNVNMKKIALAARSFFFLSKNAKKEIKDQKKLSLLQVVEKEVNPVLTACMNLDKSFVNKMPWNHKKTINQIKASAVQFLKDVHTFLIEGAMVPTKILSFHLNDVMCCTKKKLGKKYQFGRIFQLGRIGGNFMFVKKSTSTHMPDKSSLDGVMQEHGQIFGPVGINSVSTDKGYYSDKNEKLLVNKDVKEIGIQRPANIKKVHPKPVSKECEENLINRRSGIEPLIGHLKHGGQMGRSRMKSDKTIPKREV